MNWPTRTTVLFIFFLLTLVSCEETSEIGLEDDVNPLGTAFTDTITVKAATIFLPDSVVAFQNPFQFAGRFTNNQFGTVAAQAFMRIGISAGATFTDAATARVDSTVLVLDYNESYGDTTQNLTLNVHKLQQAFQDEVTYYTNTILPYDPTVIGTVTFKPTPRKINKKVVTVNNQSTTVTQSYPVRIKLNNAFGNDLLAQSGKTPLSNQAEFNKFLPGLALRSADNAQAALGFIQTDSTYFRVYYTAGDKKLQYNLFISADHSTHLTTNRSNSALAALQGAGDAVPATSTSNTAYLQESVGIKTKFTFPYLAKFKQALGNVAINRAELVIPVKSPEVFKPSPYIYLYQANSSNRIARYSGNYWGIASYGNPIEAIGQPVAGVYRATKQNYTIDVTSYLQAVLYNRKLANGISMQNTGLILSPASTPQLTNITALHMQSLRQTLINMAPGSGVKLRVYYSTNQ
jgi:hypothetical protein